MQIFDKQLCYPDAPAQFDEQEEMDNEDKK